MDYIFRITACLSHRNNRDHSVYTDLKIEDMNLISSADLSAFKNHLKDIVSDNNEVHTRCKPMQIEFSRVHEKDNITVSFDRGQITARIEKIQGLYKKEA